MGVYTENRDLLIHHLAGFLNQVQYQKDNNTFVSSYKSAEGFVDNEIAIEKGMAEYYEWGHQCERSDRRLLRAIAAVKGKTFVKHIKDIIDDSTTTGTRMVILREPIGKFQEEKHGREIKGIWIDQWATGMEGDGFAGTICIEIRKGTYLKFDFSI